MNLLTATYKHGRLDVPDGTVHEGDVVTPLVSEAEEEFNLRTDERNRFRHALAQTDRREGLAGWELLEELRG